MDVGWFLNRQLDFIRGLYASASVPSQFDPLQLFGQISPPPTTAMQSLRSHVGRRRAARLVDRPAASRPRAQHLKELAAYRTTQSLADHWEKVRWMCA